MAATSTSTDSIEFFDSAMERQLLMDLPEPIDLSVVLPRQRQRRRQSYADHIISGEVGRRLLRHFVDPYHDQLAPVVPGGKGLLMPLSLDELELVLRPLFTTESVSSGQRTLSLRIARLAFSIYGGEDCAAGAHRDRHGTTFSRAGSDDRFSRAVNSRCNGWALLDRRIGELEAEVQLGLQSIHHDSEMMERLLSLFDRSRDSINPYLQKVLTDCLNKRANELKLAHMGGVALENAKTWFAAPPDEKEPELKPEWSHASRPSQFLK